MESDGWEVEKVMGNEGSELRDNYETSVRGSRRNEERESMGK